MIFCEMWTWKHTTQELRTTIIGKPMKPNCCLAPLEAQSHSVKVCYSYFIVARVVAMNHRHCCHRFNVTYIVIPPSVCERRTLWKCITPGTTMRSWELIEETFTGQWSQELWIIFNMVDAMCMLNGSGSGQMCVLNAES